MGVFVRGMKMPTCCADCDLHNPFSETPYCRRLLQVIPLEGRMENCPLVEVPTPHGRLIDLDAALNKLIHKLGVKSLDYLTPSEKAIVDSFLNELTVIEAEE